MYHREVVEFIGITECNQESEVQHFWQFGMQQFWEQSMHRFWEQECSNCPANLG